MDIIYIYICNSPETLDTNFLKVSHGGFLHRNSHPWVPNCSFTASLFFLTISFCSESISI